MADREEKGEEKMSDAEEVEDEETVLDLGGQSLTSIHLPEGTDPKALILNNNKITKLDGLNCSRLSQLSVTNNHIVRMSGLQTLTALTVLNLSNNSIVAIENLEGLSQLMWLDLSSNSIKNIEHLPKGGRLHHLDLSDNDITHISDLSTLCNLKTLLLYSNNISSLKSVPGSLPESLTVLSLADNSIYDLNEVSCLSSLTNLQQLSISDNPCVFMAAENQGFDYRPFVWNWCPSIQILDAFVISEKERLLLGLQSQLMKKFSSILLLHHETFRLLGEWLFSQGKGRNFHPGQHVQLVEYLATACPLTSTEVLQTEEETKLSQILSQQRRYQQQLQQQSQQHQREVSQCQQSLQASSKIASVRARESQASSHTECRALGKDSIIYTSQSLDSNSGLCRSQLWANPADLSILSHSSGDRQDVQADSLILQDISSDCDIRSSVSLLESESVYLPFDVPASPVALRCPISELRSQPPASTTSSAKQTETNPCPAIGTVSKGTTYSARQIEIDKHTNTALNSQLVIDGKYAILEQRQIRPLNQYIANGSLKSNFDVAWPLSSSPEPCVSMQKDNLVSTVISQDYGSSSEQTTSESEVLSVKPYNSTQLTNTSPGSSSKAAPQDKLNLIKIVAGNKKAGHRTKSASVTAKTTAGAQVRSNTVIMKTSSTLSSATTITTTTASSMAASAVKRAHINRASYLSETGNIGKSNISLAEDRKQMKGRLNLEKLEPKKDGNSLGRDSVFLSCPASDVKDETQLLVDNKAATAIQAFWRGYWAREYNTSVVSVRKEIRARRAEDHIMLLRKELERNWKLYEEEKRLRILQMEAIRLLYHEVQVLKSQSLVSTKDLNSMDGHIGSINTTVAFSPTTTAASSTSSTSLLAYNDMNRTQELEKTCASLQTQVCHLQEALESVSSAVFKTNSLDSANFHLTDHSDVVHVIPYLESQDGEKISSEDASHWGCIPHSLSPYPSEEEEHYFLQVPIHGAPTPPRHLQLQHYSQTGLLLSWQPSCCLGQDWEEEGNRHIIGYRVYVNDQLKAFVCQQTSVLVEGLNPTTTYKFYVKALSGFGESYESNILMAKLAKGLERQKYAISSGSDSAHDSDKDVNSAEISEKVRQKTRRQRRSPRSSDKKKASSLYHTDQEAMSELLLDGSSSHLNSNNSAMDKTSFAILTHPKLHTHRRQRSRDLHKKEFKESRSETTSEESSPIPGTALKTDHGRTESHSSVNQPASTDLSVHKRESSRKLHESSKIGILQEEYNLASHLKNRTAQDSMLASRVNEYATSTDHVTCVSSTKRESPVRKRESLPSGSREQESQSHPRKREAGAEDHGSKISPSVSPCSSETENRQRILSQVGSGSGPESKKIIKSSILSETFTVNKADSYLDSLSAITESLLGGKPCGHDSSHRSRSHRRTQSRDGSSKTSEEKRNLTVETINVSPGSHNGNGSSNNNDIAEALQKETHAGSDCVVNITSHRRNRSKELIIPAVLLKRDEASLGELEVKQEKIHLNSDMTTENNVTPSLQEKKEGVGLSNQPVLDGRQHHLLGSRPNSPVLLLGVSGGEEKSRMSIAEVMMEQRAKRLNKSSSLNSLSGKTEDCASRSESSRRSPSIESLPSSSHADTSKHTVSSESLLSRGSSRGEGSKRTHSSESLMSNPTDTSKRSHSNESLPGSVRTDTSRRSPSNESLSESIREETEQSTTNQGDGSYMSASRCQRTHSLGSAGDVNHRVNGDVNKTKHGRKTTSSVVSKLLLKLESISSASTRGKKASFTSKTSNTDNKDSEIVSSKPASDDEKRSGLRSRNLSESDAEGAASDAGSHLPPKVPSDGSSGSYSDDNRHSRRGHRRTPSDHRVPASFPSEIDPSRLAHSPIIMEGGMMKKSSSNVRRNQSFHGLLPSKHQDAKTSPSLNEENFPKAENQSAPQCLSDAPVHTKSHLRSRTPSPACGRQPILSGAQLKRHSESNKSQNDSGKISSDA